MKRITRDVSRWTVYLHRRERYLPLADALDKRERKIADEIFGMLFDPDSSPEIPDASGDDVDWARSVHAACEAQGDMKKLAKECYGNARKAAQATDEILSKLPKSLGGSGGGDPTEEELDQASGLSGTDMNGSGGPGKQWTSKWCGEQEEKDRARNLADKIKDNEKLKKIAKLAGKFKRIALTKQKIKVKRGNDEITDVSQGDVIERLLPSELVRFASPRQKLAALRDLQEKKCLQYEMESLEALGRGPIVFCLDKSPSMEERDKDVWAGAVALAILENAHREHRTFILLGFNDKVPQRIVVPPGHPFPMEALLSPVAGSGTDVSRVLNLALRAVEKKKRMNKADIIVVTDGEAPTHEARLIRHKAETRNVRIFGIGIGVAKKNLAPWCDPGLYESVEKLNEIEDGTAQILFGT